jgi:hypothetical protein
MRESFTDIGAVCVGGCFQTRELCVVNFNNRQLNVSISHLNLWFIQARQPTLQLTLPMPKANLLTKLMLPLSRFH